MGDKTNSKSTSTSTKSTNNSSAFRTSPHPGATTTTSAVSVATTTNNDSANRYKSGYFSRSLPTEKISTNQEPQITAQHSVATTTSIEKSEILVCQSMPNLTNHQQIPTPPGGVTSTQLSFGGAYNRKLADSGENLPTPAVASATNTDEEAVRVEVTAHNNDFYLDDDDDIQIDHTDTTNTEEPDSDRDISLDDSLVIPAYVSAEQHPSNSQASTTWQQQFLTFVKNHGMKFAAIPPAATAWYYRSSAENNFEQLVEAFNQKFGTNLPASAVLKEMVGDSSFGANFFSTFVGFSLIPERALEFRNGWTHTKITSLITGISCIYAAFTAGALIENASLLGKGLVSLSSLAQHFLFAIPGMRIVSNSIVGTILRMLSDIIGKFFYKIGEVTRINNLLAYIKDTLSIAYPWYARAGKYMLGEYMFNAVDIFADTPIVPPLTASTLVLNRIHRRISIHATAALFSKAQEDEAALLRIMRDALQAFTASKLEDAEGKHIDIQTLLMPEIIDIIKTKFTREEQILFYGEYVTDELKIAPESNLYTAGYLIFEILKALVTLVAVSPNLVVLTNFTREKMLPWLGIGASDETLFDILVNAISLPPFFVKYLMYYSAMHYFVSSLHYNISTIQYTSCERGNYRILIKLLACISAMVGILSSAPLGASAMKHFDELLLGYFADVLRYIPYSKLAYILCTMILGSGMVNGTTIFKHISEELNSLAEGNYPELASKKLAGNDALRVAQEMISQPRGSQEEFNSYRAAKICDNNIQRAQIPEPSICSKITSYVGSFFCRSRTETGEGQSLISIASNAGTSVNHHAADLDTLREPQGCPFFGTHGV